MNIGQIRWPNDLKMASLLYLRFILQLIQQLNIQFLDSKPDPVSTAKGYINGDVNENEYLSAADVWWNHLEKSGSIDHAQDEDAIKARLAIFLLSAKFDSEDDLGEHLSWFFELLEELGINLTEAINMMRQFFDFDV